MRGKWDKVFPAFVLAVFYVGMISGGMFLVMTTPNYQGAVLAGIGMFFGYIAGSPRS